MNEIAVSTAKNLIDNVLIVKVGTSTLTRRNDSGLPELDIQSFDRIAKQIVNLRGNGHNVAIVSSAAITAGMAATGLANRPTNQEEHMPTLQGLASVGWRYIMNAWDDALGGLLIGELLITKHELELDSERSELLKVTHNLMSRGHIPIINENDAITHEEIAFGDNDTLAAIYASKLKQSELFGDNISVIILSDIDGVYEDIDDKSTLIKQIADISKYERVAHAKTGDGGTGGMVTKFNAAKIAQASGIDLYIANGRSENAISRTLNENAGTHFTA
jgi:glutamate 5-kinase